MSAVDTFTPYPIPTPDSQKGPPRGRIYLTIRHGRDFFPSPGLVDELDLKRGESYAVEINPATRRLRLSLVAKKTPGALVLRRSGGQLTPRGRRRVYTRSHEVCTDLGIPGYMTHVCRARGWIENGTKMIEFEYPKKENEV